MRKELWALKRPYVEPEYERRKFRVRRPLRSIGLEPAVQQDSYRVVLFIQSRRRSDLVVVVRTYRVGSIPNRDSKRKPEMIKTVAQILR